MTAPPSIIVDLACRTVVMPGGAGIRLSWAEFSLLAELVEAQGAIRTRAELAQAALRRPYQAGDRTVDQIVFQLRRKLPRDADGSYMIRSVRGAGYWLRLVAREDADTDRWVA